MSQTAAGDKVKSTSLHEKPDLRRTAIQTDNYCLAVVAGQVVSSLIDRVRVNDNGTITMPQ
jgi:hypothetical protein